MITILKQARPYLLSIGILTAFFVMMQQPVSAITCTQTAAEVPACTTISVDGIKIPTLGGILTFALRAFFVIAGLAALFYMLMGAFAWVTSGGDKDAISAAREKIQAAVVGLILVVAVLAIVWTLEQVIFKRRICLGLSCPLTMPGLIETTSDEGNCCVCEDGTTVIDAFDPAQTCPAN